MTTLYWLTNDLRVKDNPALNEATLDDELTCVYCFDNLDLGVHRRRFLTESLRDLKIQFAAYKLELLVIEMDPQEALNQLLGSNKFDRVVMSRQHAINEVRLVQSIEETYSQIAFVVVDSSTLYSNESVDFDGSFPDSFSKFKRQMQSEEFRSLIDAPIRLAKISSPKLYDVNLEILDFSAINFGVSEPVGNELNGGEIAGAEKVANYFSTDAASSYKETRNHFIGQNFSTTFSPWLAHGCVSPIQIVNALNQYESEFGENDSTQWIVFELLWREFFRWYGQFYGSKLFTLRGVSHTDPISDFDLERFDSWRQGTTAWPIVNACMNELRQTGWLSNRGRQIAASCLINELGLDWRCGAGYFEECLIDYDPCSNWGNWQYIAGVGADPRGGRHFNLEKQAEMWDPDFAYRERWAAKTQPSLS